MHNSDCDSDSDNDNNNAHFYTLLYAIATERSVASIGSRNQ